MLRKMDVSSALRETIDELGWSPTKAAAECGVSARTMESLLAGGTPSGPTFLALLKQIPGFARRYVPELFADTAAAA